MQSTIVASAREFLDSLSGDQSFDCAIVDFQLPDMDGLSLTEAVRASSGGQSLRIVSLNSAHLRAGELRVAATGVSASVYKPIRPKLLLEALKRTFDPQQTSIRKASSDSIFDPQLGSRLPLRILVADDNRVNQRVCQGLLGKLGYRADVVSNGLEVLQALELQPYDLIFLDVQMPEMDGFSAAREIERRWSKENRPRIVALTGEAMQGDREKCLEAGMDDYLVKPIRIIDLRATIERWGAEVPLQKI
jgi:CheY-like chemotaxis protein